MIKTGMLPGLAVILALTAACGPGAEEDAGEGEMPMMQDEAMLGMGMGDGGGMMDDMGAHLSMMAAMHGDSLMAQLPMHRQMLANMIARMNREMADMDMAADAAWNATVDSLRADLVRMPDMDAAELEAMMPEHRARAMRLIEMHRAMMAEMGM
jgi:hypothetical protein